MTLLKLEMKPLVSKRPVSNLPENTFAVRPRLSAKNWQKQNFFGGFSSDFIWCKMLNESSYRIRVFGCITVNRELQLLVNGPTNSVLYLFVKLKCTPAPQRDNDPNTTASPALKKDRMRVVEWPNQSLPEMLSCDPKDPFMWSKNNRDAEIKGPNFLCRGSPMLWYQRLFIKRFNEIVAACRGLTRRYALVTTGFIGR